MRRDLPSGQVTFLFTDIEGSTRLLHELGEGYAQALAEHRRSLRDAFGGHGGVEVDTQGDAFFVAFPRAKEALAAATEAQEALGAGPIRVRMGLHTGEPTVTEEGYVGIEVHRGARIAAAGHGGQVVVSKETRELVGDAWSFTDLGEHRVKDFAEPVWIFQLGEERFPPLKTISNTNLPRPPSSFVGREREVSEVAALLQDSARLVTLTGPGGTGKTRLAIEAAAELVPEHRNGVFWVGLATLRDPALVQGTISQMLGAKDGPAEHIGEREMLLVLDNFEQVVEAAPELSSLLSACSNLRLLVTSRELLRVQGEVEYAVPPLADREAVDLFCTRGRLQADETIAELCRRLDNLPLAIELAAARSKVLSPAQILERLSERLDLLKGGRDAEARQRTLRATIEWSHDLLDEEEKRLFARLSVFRGGCTLEAAEEVADADLDTLQSLLDKSLLRGTSERFWMLETIREYATERLAKSGESDALQRRHAEHFLALAEEGEPHLRGSDPKDWLDRLEREHNNLRAALDRLEVSGEGEAAVRLPGALSRFWYLRGHFAEGGRRLESALRNEGRPTASRAKALNGASVMAFNVRDLATARARAEEALALHLQLGDDWGAAYSIMMLGNIAGEDGDWKAARPLYEDSLRRFRELGDEDFEGIASDNLAYSYEQLGDRERARELSEENLRRARANRDKLREAMALGELASLALDDGGIEDALSMLTESLPVWRDIGSLQMVARDLRRLASALTASGRAWTATQLLSCSVALDEQTGAKEHGQEATQETISAIRTQLDEDAFAEAWDQGHKLTVDEAVALALGEVS